MDGLSFSSWLGGFQGAGAGKNEGYFRNVPNITPNKVPALWLQFAKGGEGLINQSYAARRRALAGGRQTYERGLRGALQGAGVDDLFARRQLAESLPQHQYQYGELEAGRLSELLDFRSGITNALAESNSSERQLDLQGYLAAKARSASRQGARSASRSGLLGAAIGAGGSALGGYLGRPPAAPAE